MFGLESSQMLQFEHAAMWEQTAAETVCCFCLCTKGGLVHRMYTAGVRLQLAEKVPGEQPSIPHHFHFCVLPF